MGQRPVSDLDQCVGEPPQWAQAGIFHTLHEQQFVVLRSLAPWLAKGTRCLRPFVSRLLPPDSWLLAPHSSLVTRHSSLVTRHSSLVTRHSSLVTRHSSLVTRHSSLLFSISTYAMKVKRNLQVLEATKCRCRKASVARTCFVGPRLFLANRRLQRKVKRRRSKRKSQK